MMLQTIAIIFGIIVLAIGVLGLYPLFAPHGLLFGLFHVNNIHNLIHVATGVAAILCGLNSLIASRFFFQVFGVIYAIIAIVGFFYGGQSILNVIANNMADNWLHTVIAIIALYLGFAYRSDQRN